MAHEGTAMGNDLDEPFGVQPTHRFAHRRATEARSRSQSLGSQMGARRIATSDDSFADFEIGLVDGGRHVCSPSIWFAVVFLQRSRGLPSKLHRSGTGSDGTLYFCMQLAAR